MPDPDCHGAAYDWLVFPECHFDPDIVRKDGFYVLAITWFLELWQRVHGSNGRTRRSERRILWLPGRGGDGWPVSSIYLERQARIRRRSPSPTFHDYVGNYAAQQPEQQYGRRCERSAGRLGAPGAGRGHESNLDWIWELSVGAGESLLRCCGREKAFARQGPRYRNDVRDKAGSSLKIGGLKCATRI